MRTITSTSLAAALAASVLLTACGTTGTATSRGPLPPTHVEEVGDGYLFRVSNNGGPAIAEFPETVDEVWDVMIEAYRNVGIEIGTLEERSYTIGNREMNGVRQVGTLPVQRIVECDRGGLGAMGSTGSRVRLSILSTLSPSNAGGTRLETTIEATATPMSGGSRAPQTCLSSGQLERLLVESVNQSLRS